MTITTGELNNTRDAKKTDISTYYTHIGFGTGTTTPSPSDTQLVAEVVRVARIDSTSSTNSVTVSGYIDATQGNGSTITESGVFDAASSGNMKCRKKFPLAITKTSDKEVWADFTTTTTVTQV
jgi:hypothetical protein